MHRANEWQIVDIRVERSRLSSRPKEERLELNLKTSCALSPKLYILEIPTVVQRFRCGASLTSRRLVFNVYVVIILFILLCAYVLVHKVSVSILSFDVPF